MQGSNAVENSIDHGNQRVRWQRSCGNHASAAALGLLQPSNHQQPRERHGSDIMISGVCGSKLLSWLKEYERESCAPTHKMKAHCPCYLITITARFTHPAASSFLTIFSMWSSVQRARDNVSVESQQQSSVSAEKGPDVAIASSGLSVSERSGGGRSTLVPVKMKLISVLLVTAIGFGSHWSSGVTGAMKSTLKKVLEFGTAKSPNGADRSSNCTSTTRNMQCWKHPRIL